MSVEAFLDTNVLVYAAAGRGAEERKRRRAVELIEAANWGLSVQVLQEFYVCVVRKIAKPMTPAEAMEWVRRLRAFPCVAIDADLVELGIETSVRHQICYWDGAVVAAAERLGAAILYSEDLNDGQVNGSVRVKNPFG